MEKITPTFLDRNAICLCSDRNYFKYLYVTILSIIKNINKDSYIDIVILSENFSEEQNCILCDLSSNNINIIIKNIDSNIFDNLFVSGYITLAAYFRLIIPIVFSNYNKVLYIDADLVVVSDISKVFDCNLNNKLLGVVREPDRFFFDKERIEYNRYILGVITNDYFCSGVILFNISECIKFNLCERCFDFLDRNKCPKYHDQDVLNSVTFSKNVFLPEKFHLMVWCWWTGGIERLKKINNIYYKNIINSINNAVIFHYGGTLKPWNDNSIPFAEEWWKYAKISPYYKDFLINLLIIKEKNIFKLLKNKKR